MTNSDYFSHKLLNYSRFFIFNKGSFTYYVTQKNEILDPPSPLVLNFARKFFFVLPVTKSQTPLPPKNPT